jgi:uncharacterized integral membrane protein (TIGR02327 family)
MDLVRFIVKSAVYLVFFLVSWYALGAVDYEKSLKKGHVRQAQILYVLLVCALAYLAGSFFLSFLYTV